MRTAEDIIRRPLMTEKSSRLKEADGVEGGASQVVLEVAADANKIEIRKAVEKIWNVEVRAVRTLVVPGKTKRVGRYLGKRSNWKKAIVTLAAGQSIEFVAGV